MAHGPAQSLYDRDFYAWTQQQAAELRRLRGINHGNVEIEHVAAEIEDLGKRDRRALESNLHEMLRHLIKLAWSPAHEPRAGWLREVRSHWRNARAIVQDSPNLPAKLDLARIWTAAHTDANADLRDQGEAPLPGDVGPPLALESLLADDVDFESVAARIARAGRDASPSA